MKRIGIVSYNLYCNFTNYGSALQSWALSESIKKAGYEPVLLDYCPQILGDKDPLNPIKNMWDTDEKSHEMCRKMLPAIKVNYEKFEKFYRTNGYFNISRNKFNDFNFDSLIKKEDIDGFVCGSDTIFCIDEFKGFVEGYYANFESMKQKSVAFSASFGDAHFDEQSYKTLNERLKNFKAVSLRESHMVGYCRDVLTVPVQHTLDPTLLLDYRDYQKITAQRQENAKYILVYARRHNQTMIDYADKVARERGLKVVEISLWADNADSHRMFYEAGVEEFLSLVKYAEFVITNSFHAAIFSVHFKRPFVIFSREQCDNKIDELLSIMGLSDRKMITSQESISSNINYDCVYDKLLAARDMSRKFLEMELSLL